MMEMQPPRPSSRKAASSRCDGRRAAAPEKAPDDAEALNAVFRAAPRSRVGRLFRFNDIVDSRTRWRASCRRGLAMWGHATLIALLLSCGYVSALITCLSSSDSQPDNALRVLVSRFEVTAGADLSSALGPGEDPVGGRGGGSRCRRRMSCARDGSVVLHSLSRHAGRTTVATRSMPCRTESMDPVVLCRIEIEFRGRRPRSSEKALSSCAMLHAALAPPAERRCHPPSSSGAAASASTSCVRADNWTAHHAHRRAGHCRRAPPLGSAGNSESIESTVGSEALVEQIRDGALKLRMVPIGDTFTVHPRGARPRQSRQGSRAGPDWVPIKARQSMIEA
jgi:hypothetical protein